MDDISGKRFGKLTALEFVGQNKRYESYWLCACDCGETKVVNVANLRTGDTKSCGCLHRQQLIERNKAFSGSASWCWKGGITDLNHQIRNSNLFYRWRESVWARDNFTCQRCGKRGGKLCSHHVRYMNNILTAHKITSLDQALECDDLWDVSNGLTLCPKCHKKEHQDNGYRRGQS